MPPGTVRPGGPTGTVIQAAASGPGGPARRRAPLRSTGRLRLTASLSLSEPLPVAAAGAAAGQPPVTVTRDS